MLVYDPEERLSAHDLLRHPWLYERSNTFSQIVDAKFIENLI
jgi:serine/threonine protein kinase